MKIEMACRSSSPKETQAIGEALASVLVPGDVVALSGDLGAGKTCLVQGVARAMGVPDRVTSPSFIIMREYQGTLPLLHMDVYRLNTMQELIDLGIDEFLDPSRVVVVEWGDAVAPLLPDERLEVDLHMSSETERAVGFRWFGGSWGRRAHLLADALGPFARGS